jgi:hypothetical protein
MKTLSIIILLSIMFGIVLSQESRSSAINRLQPFTIQPILGASGILGLRYGLALGIANNWSIEYARGWDADINLGGGEYAMTFSGMLCNRYFPIQERLALMGSLFYLRAYVSQTSNHYTGDFSRYGAMLGIDFSGYNGLGSFVRGGVAFATPNYFNGRTSFAIDVGIYYRIHIFGAP